jgi:hypothetical protein
MAINVNDVYQTVLTILNKEQRGYMTPFEFNKIASQVQLEIFERYFEDLNQQARIPQTDVDYADRLFATEEKLEAFRKTADLTYDTNGFTIPSDLYKLGNVTFRNYYQDDSVNPNIDNFGDSYVEVEKVNRHEFNLLRNANLTSSSLTYPQYLYEENKIKVVPSSITKDNSIVIDYIKKPSDVVWAYEIGSLGQYIYSANGASDVIPNTGSVDFELEFSERSEVIINILFYAGVVIRDPQIVQVASQKIQQEEVNEKS